MVVGGESLAGLVLPMLVLPAWFIGGRRSPRNELERGTDRPWISRILGMSVLCFVLGRVVALYAGSVLNGSASAPTGADAAYVSSYLALSLGVIMLCRQQLPVVSGMRIVADRLMILSAVGTFGWYFIVGPLLGSEALPISARITDAVYAGFDVILVFCMLLLASRFRAEGLRPTLALLGLAGGTLLLCHAASMYGVAHQGYAQTPELDLAWSLAYVLVAMAGAAVRLGIRRPRVSAAGDNPAPSAGTPTLWRYVLPYALIPGVVALMVYEAHMRSSAFLETGVYVAASVMIEMVFIHQFLSYRELTSYANRNARLENLAAADPVTGLPNHRSVVTALDTTLAGAEHTEMPVSLLFLDLDHFKALNDHFGHSVGDQALREFAAVVRTALRETDTLGRWGGEEFVALLPDSDRTVAQRVAERVCASVASHAFRTVGGSHMTCSIGVATYPEDGRERTSLVEAADAAMYAAKQQGRNRVCAATAERWTGQQKASTREEAALAGTILALQTLARPYELRDESELVDLALQMARALDMDAPSIRTVEQSVRLRDIGKYAAILRGQSRLSSQDSDMPMSHTHPLIAAEIVSCVPALRILAPILRAHHERWDGSGYPNGLAGEAIPLIARMIAVAECYHGLVSGHGHRYPLPPSLALAEIEQHAGTWFDPAMVQVLVGIVSHALHVDDQMEIA